MLRQRGQREVFCGLTGIVWLHRKIQDAFFLVVGSRTCAHLIQSAAGVMIFAEPRFATAIIDERDLAGLADSNEELDRVVGQLLDAPARYPAAVPGRLLPVRGDQARPVARRRAAVAAAFAARARAQLFRQRHRDHLHAGRGLLPRRAGARICDERPPMRALAAGRGLPARHRRGSVPPAVRRAGHRPGAISCRLAAPRDLPPVGRGTRVLLAQPFLGETAPALAKRGAQLLAAPFPFGAEGTTALAAGRRRCLAASTRAHFRKRHRRRAANAPNARLPHYRDRARRQARSSSSPIRRWSHRWRASWPANSAMRAGRGRHALSQSPASSRTNSRCCPTASLLSEGQDVDRQLDRCRAAAPDLVVCGLGLANPLEARGHRPPNGRSSWCSRRSMATSRPAISPSCSRGRWSAGRGWRS